MVAHGAEFLVQGYLMRRNILAYKAPPGNEGYDLICIHPNPRKASRQIRVQVKSRYATDSNREFPVKAASLDAFDYLVVAFLNIGYFFGKARSHPGEGRTDVELYTLPADFIRRHHDKSSSWQKVKLRGLGDELERFKGEQGFELIAKELGIADPVVELNRSGGQGATAGTQ